MAKKSGSFLREHSLSLVAAAVLLLWIVLYARSDPDTHAGAFFGNAAADWTGTVVMVIGTKFLFERGSKESKPVRVRGSAVHRFLRAHSLTLVLAATGLGWLFLYSRLDPTSKWGQVVGNVLSEWVQVLGLAAPNQEALRARLRGEQEAVEGSERVRAVRVHRRPK